MTLKRGVSAFLLTEIFVRKYKSIYDRCETVTIETFKEATLIILNFEHFKPSSVVFIKDSLTVRCEENVALLVFEVIM